MEKETIIEKLREYYKNKKEAEFVYLFGSYAKGKSNRKSDIDVAVYLNENVSGEFFEYKMGVVCQLQDLLGKSVDVVILNNAEPILVHQVFRYGVLLKGSESRILVEFRRLNFYRYLDQMRISRILFEKNKKRIRESIQGG